MLSYQAHCRGLVSRYPLVDRHVLEQMRLLPEGLGAVLAAEGLLAGVGAEVDLDVGLVEEASVAHLAVVHHLLALVPAGARTRATQQRSLQTVNVREQK